VQIFISKVERVFRTGFSTHDIQCPHARQILRLAHFHGTEIDPKVELTALVGEIFFAA